MATRPFAKLAIPKLADAGSALARLKLPRLWPTMASGRRLGNYSRVSWPWPIIALFYLVLIAFSLIYGFGFGIVASQLITPFFVPPLLLAMVVIWTLPEQRYPPVKWIARLMPAFVFALLIWPDYIALVLGSLPWITALRTVCLPLTLVLAVCYVASKRFRTQFADIARPSREIQWAAIGFMAIAAFSIIMSRYPPVSAMRFGIIVYSNYAIFIASCYYFIKPGRIIRFSIYLLIAAVLSTIVVFFEVRLRHVPWAGHIPSFLQIEDPRLLMMLSGEASFRAASGEYRAQSKFSTSIGLGEYLGLAIPFILHLAYVTNNKFLKMTCLVMIPALFWVVLSTGSRLAFVCYLSSVVLYVLFRALIAWRENPKSLFPPALVLAYPAFMALLIAASLVWRRLGVMIWGDGAAQASTQSRKDQWAMGWPKIFHNPLGYGVGMSGDALGYISPGSDFPTVDSYYLTAFLEFGILGYAFYFGFFGIAMFRSGLTALKTNDRELQFLFAACIALLNFIISKSVYSQTENHPLAFLLVGMIVALIRRYNADVGKAPPPPLEEDLMRPPVSHLKSQP